MIGVDPATLAAYDLQPDPCVPNKRERVMQSPVAAAYIEEWGWGYDSDPIPNHMPVDVLDEVFTISEIVRIWAAQIVMSDISRHIEEHHPLLEKMRHSAHHYTHYAKDGPPIYDVILAAWRGLQRMAWPGGEIRIAYVSKWREDGWAEDVPSGCNIWIDSDLGALIHIGNKHVLTVGFGVGRDGVFLSQVQLRQKKGNRWLYSLGKHYLDAAIDMLASAFVMPVWLVDGDTAVKAVRRSYGKSKCSLTDEDERRIASFYDRPLASVRRTDERRTHYGRTYSRLEDI